jgi:UDP-galactopyranose mutase
MKAVIVGCGISGATAAFLLKNKGYDVEVFETRNHIAGNCYDEIVHGVTVHKYGAHVFHTNREEIWNFVNKFAKFNNFCPKVWANTKEGLIPIPYNDITRDIIGDKTKEEIIDLIFRDYSEKMWGESWENLPAEITSRIAKIKDGTDRCYHKDPHYGVPIGGFVKMFENMLEGIKVHVGCNPTDWQIARNRDLLVFTGPIDSYFRHCYGRLDYRSLIFEWHKGEKQKVFQINECTKDKTWLRSIDHSFFYGNENLKHGIIHKEYSCAHDQVFGSNEPFYPVNFGKNPMIYKKYKELANKEKNVIFTGRLATYKYIDLDTAISQTMGKMKGT